MEKVIATVGIVGSNALELQGAITRLIAAARMACDGQNWGGGTTLDVENEAGEELAHIDLIEETLSDSSKVYNIRLRFSSVE